MIGLAATPARQARTYAHIAKAGFNVIIGQVDPKALDLAHQHGLRLAIGRVSLQPSTLEDDKSRELAASTLRRIRRHPALWGYVLTDRAREAHFPAWGRVARFVREQDPGAGVYIELLPCDAFVGPELATADYAAYLERFVRAVDAPVLVVAQRPFRARGASTTYYENLELLRAASLANGLPFVHGLQGGPGRGLRAPSEGELRWQAYVSLAYGAKGLVWSNWWGAPDPQAIQRARWLVALNAELAALGRQLLPLRSVAVAHTGDIPTGAARLAPHTLVGGIEGGDVVVGRFRDWKARQFLLIVSKDTAKPVSVTVTLNQPDPPVWVFDARAGLWRRLTTRSTRSKTEFDLNLPPGGGRLVRLDPPGD